MSKETTSLTPMQAMEELANAFYPHQRTFLVPNLVKSQFEAGILGALSQGELFALQRNLMKLLGASRTSVTLVLDEMERKGLIVRQDDDKDKRGNFIALTKKGKDVLAWQWDRKKRYEDILYDGISAEELQLHAMITQKMVNNLVDISERQMNNMPSFESFSGGKKVAVTPFMSEEYQKAFVSMVGNVNKAKKKSAQQK